MKLAKPNVFLIAKTELHQPGRDAFLNHIGAQGWETNAPSASEELIEIAGKTCYMSFNTDLNKNLTRVREKRNRDYIQNGIIAVNHGSVLEHSSVTFAITNVSRIFTHELVRHRAGCAYSQVSGRYVRTDELEAYDPEIFTPEEKETFVKALEQIEILYKDFETQAFERVGDDFGTKKKVTSALRRIMPNGQNNTIIFTANHRAMRHIINMRTDPHAEEEIIDVFEKIRDVMKAEFPNIYEDM